VSGSPASSQLRTRRLLAAAEREHCSTPELASSWWGVGRWLSPASPEFPPGVRLPPLPPPPLPVDHSWAADVELRQGVRVLGDPHGGDAEVGALAHKCVCACACMRDFKEGTPLCTFLAFLTLP